MTVREHTAELRLDYVYRFEELPQSLRMIDQVEGLHSIRLEKCGEKLGRHWQSFYDQQRAERVHAICRADFEEFGYAKASWRS